MAKKKGLLSKLFGSPVAKQPPMGAQGRRFASAQAKIKAERKHRNQRATDAWNHPDNRSKNW